MNTSSTRKVFFWLTLILGTGVVTACSNEQDIAQGEVVSTGVQACTAYSGYELINGRIITMDESDSVVSSLMVENGRIVALGATTNDQESASCHQVIDLAGRTVIPGLIDSHVHFVRAGSAPGHDLRAAETAFSIAELLQLIQTQVQLLPEDQVISIIGGIVPQQFAENRFPTLQELDAVAPNHAVYAQRGFFGPAFTNSVGKQLFVAKGISVAQDGTIEAGKATGAAFMALKATQTDEDRKQGLQRLQKYANSLGLTTVADEGGVLFPGAGFFDPSNDYQAILDLWREQKLTVRIRAQRLSYDSDDQPGKVEDFLDNAWSRFGDEFLKITALGEHIVSFPRNGEVNSAYGSKISHIAMKAWSHEQHSTSFMENQQHIDAIEAVHAKYPITELRWSLSHVFELGHDGDLSAISSLKSMGMGLRVQNHGYSVPTDQFPLGRTLGGANSGPLYRTLVDSGIRLGAGSDGALVGPINPWLSIYYMLSGMDSGGQLVNEGQTLTRLEALSLYTRDNAWFTFDEQDLGSLEVGKTADLAVLNGDYLNLPLAEIKTLGSVLTMVGGIVVYTDPEQSIHLVGD